MKFANFKKILKFNLFLSLIVLLSFNTFAWFVYSSRVSNSITTKVRAWKVNFEFGENEVAEYINFNIDSLYPGMANYINTINIVNFGESPATLTFEIIDIRIMEDEYIGDETNQNTLIAMLSDDFPFSVDLSLSNTVLDADGGESDFIIDVSWPFESGNDILDTFWGAESYDYQNENPGSPGIVIFVKIIATQVVD